MKTRALFIAVAFVLCAFGIGLWWHYRPHMADEGPGGNTIKLSLHLICESVIYCDNAVKRIERIDDESIRTAVLLSAGAEPRAFSSSSAGYVLLYVHDGVTDRIVLSKEDALATSASLREHPESKSRIDATGVIDRIANRIGIQGNREKVILTSPGFNRRFGDKDDEVVYINLEKKYFYDDRYSMLGSYETKLDVIRRTYPTAPPITLIPESRY